VGRQLVRRASGLQSPAETLLADLRRWLREGLDDGSFVEARAELDAVDTMLTNAVASEPPGAIPGATHIAADGTITSRVVVGSLQARPLSERNRALQVAVEHFKQWRDCRRNTILHPADPAPVLTKVEKAAGVKHTKGKGIDARMLKVLLENFESHGWSATQWANHLGCASGTVKGTPTWKEKLKATRAIQKAEAATRSAKSGAPRGKRRKRN
jgi:hypothetical protein